MVRKGHMTGAGERTKAAILDAALRLLGRAGPDGFSASSLAVEAGVSKATLFHHFQSVDEIPLAAFERYWLSSLGGESRKSGSPRHYLCELGEQLIIQARKDREFLRAQLVFTTKAMFDARLRSRLEQGATQMHRVVVKELSARLPDASREEIEFMARSAEMALDGLMISLLLRSDRKEMKKARRVWLRFVELLLANQEEA